MSEEESTPVYIYNGVGVVPEDVSHVRVDPSVTVIPEQSFFGHEKLEEVELPEGLVTIGDNAFSDCKSLKRINIPSTVIEIGYNAFQGCNKLNGITLPDGLQTVGMYAFSSCTSLQRINIPPGITQIKLGGFFFCKGLTKVMFSEGIIELGNAFGFCESLVSVQLPSSLRVIGGETFQCCGVLNEIHMPNSIVSIGPRAFLGCNLINFRLPPLIINVDLFIFGNLNGNNNKCLVSLELSENITQITITSGHSQPRLESLRNVALPSECEVDADALLNFTDLRVAFPNEDMDTISEALQHRFDDLPIHKICYYQSYHDNETTMQYLKREINPWTSKPPGQLNRTGKQQDCLGMTPLHILSCSTKPTIEMYQLLIEKYPETLIVKDKWGDIPLLYALWCNAPNEVLDLLVESYKSLHPDYEFDWSGMMQTLAKRNIPLPNIQKLINTHQSSYPNQEYDLQSVVTALASSNATQASLHQPFTNGETFRYLLWISIIKRLDLLDITKWRIDLENSISILSLPGYNGSNREVDTQLVYDRLATYESIKEGTSVLELALWKAKIDEGRNKRARVGEDVSYKEQCRVNSGADIIIRNVLPYLLPKLARRYRW